MKFPTVRKRVATEGETGVYATLDSLVRLQFKASGFSFLPRQPVHSILAGRHASRLRGRGMDFEEIRRYLPGDDIRNMDWKVTARMRKPHVRVYTEERDRPAMYVVDQRMSMFFGSRDKMKSVAAAELLAIGAWRSLSLGDRVGAIIFGDDDQTLIRANRSRDHVTRVLQTVIDYGRRLDARQQSASDRNGLNEALEKANRICRHDCLVCIVSDFNGADADTRRLATELTRHNDVLAAFISDPLEARLPSAGRLVVSEDADQLEFDSSSKSLQTAYATAFDERLAHVSELSRKRSIPLLPISTDGDVASQLRNLLGMQGARR